MPTAFEIEVTRKVKISLDDFMVYCASLYPDQSRVDTYKQYIFTNLFNREITFVLPTANTECFDLIIELQKIVRDEAAKEGIRTRIICRNLSEPLYIQELKTIAKNTTSEVAVSISFN